MVRCAGTGNLPAIVAARQMCYPLEIVPISPSAIASMLYPRKPEHCYGRFRRDQVWRRRLPDKVRDKKKEGGCPSFFCRELYYPMLDVPVSTRLSLLAQGSWLLGPMAALVTLN